MVQWIHSHPYLFYTMFLFSLVAMTGMVAEISRAFASSNKQEKKQND